MNAIHSRVLDLKWDFIFIFFNMLSIFIGLDIFPHFVLMQPNGISISYDKFIHIHSINRRTSLYSNLLAIHENPLIFLLALSLCSFSSSFLRCCEFLFNFWHF